MNCMTYTHGYMEIICKIPMAMAVEISLHAGHIENPYFEPAQVETILLLYSFC